MPSLRNLTLAYLPHVSGELPSKWASGMMTLQFLSLRNVSVTGMHSS